MIVDRSRHLKIEKNHTATHILDQALRNILGGHTQQAGSLVEANYLRFDFNHFGSVTKDDLNKVEQMVNEQIWREIPIKTVETDLESAKDMAQLPYLVKNMGMLSEWLKLAISILNFVVVTTSRIRMRLDYSRLSQKQGLVLEFDALSCNCQ